MSTPNPLLATLGASHDFGSGHLTITERRALGAYYTPGDAAEYMAAWTLHGGGQRLLEPSAGDGVFLEALDRVASANAWEVDVQAVEFDTEAHRRMTAREYENLQLRAVLQDFMLVPAEPVDAVIGNPPFVRVRHLGKDARAAAMSCSSRYLQSPMDPAGSTWMPFILHACEFLRPGGRLAFVLPYEMTYVRYAFPLWQFLAKTFGSLRVVRVHERIFPGLLQEVVMLFADERNATTSSVVFEAYNSLSDLTTANPVVRSVVRIEEISEGRPFVNALLDPEMGVVRQRLSGRISRAGSSASFRIGYVSGDKTFFQPGSEAIERFGIDSSSLRPAVSGARRLRGQGLWTSNLDDDRPLYLPNPAAIGEADRRYIEHGEATGVDQRYKCRIRKPWYVVPGVRVPSAVITVFSETPLLMANDADRVASNSLLCVYLKSDVRKSTFARQWYTSVTLLGIEEEVHSLGGGVFVLVPREAGRIHLVDPQFVGSTNLDNINGRLVSGDIVGAYHEGDESLITAGVLSRDELEILRDSIQRLNYWRTSSRA